MNINEASPHITLWARLKAEAAELSADAHAMVERFEAEARALFTSGHPYPTDATPPAAVPAPSTPATTEGSTSDQAPAPVAGGAVGGAVVDPDLGGAQGSAESGNPQQAAGSAG